MALSARILTADANSNLRLENLPELPQTKINGLETRLNDLPRKAFIDVRDFGATGDGVTDDTTAIQAAWASLQPGQTLYFGPGDYRCDHLTFSGKSEVSVKADGARIISYAAEESTVLFLNCESVQAVGLDISSSVKVERNTSSYGLRFEDCTKIRANGNTVHDVECAGIYLVRTSGFRITDNTVYGTLADGIHVTDSSNEGLITGNLVHDTQDDGIACVSYSANAGLVCNVTITGNNVSRSLARGITCNGGENVTITGNSVSETRAAGIISAHESSYNLAQTNRVVISGNVIYKANDYQYSGKIQGGIHISSSGPGMVKHVTITDNTVHDSKNYGCLIFQGAEHVTVTGNTFTGNGQSGIKADGAAHVTISDNTSMGNSRYGIAAVGVKGRFVCDGNYLDGNNHDSTDSARRGIFVDAPLVTGGSVSRNHVDDTPAKLTKGIEVVNTGNVYFENNLSDAGIRFPNSQESSLGQVLGGLVVGSYRDATAGGGKCLIALRDTPQAPTGNPEGGGAIYVDNGSLFYRGKNGTVTKIAEA